MSIPIDLSGSHRQMAAMQRDFSALAAPKIQPPEKPNPSTNATQAVNQVNPLATQNGLAKITPINTAATEQVSQQEAHVEVPAFVAFKQAPVAPRPNHFQLEIQGPDPDLAVGGTPAQQEQQRNATVLLIAGATASYGSRALPGFMRTPPDSAISSTLNQLIPNPPIGTDGKDVTHAVYQSEIPNATPQQVFDHWVQNTAVRLNEASQG